MSPAEALAILAERLRMLAGTRDADTLADLLALAYPAHQLDLTVGFGDQLPALRPAVESLIAGWSFVGRLNVPGADAFRDAAIATSFALGRAEMAETLALEARR